MVQMTPNKRDSGISFLEGTFIICSMLHTTAPFLFPFLRHEFRAKAHVVIDSQSLLKVQHIFFRGAF
jgi:hypothetical protein